MHHSTLVAHRNVIVTPHIAFNSHEAIARINRITVDNIEAFVAGAPRHMVGPKARAPRVSRGRRVKGRS